MGRAPELAALRADVASVLRGRGRVVAIEGEAGIGKTRLIEELLRGYKLLSHQAAAEELSGRRPFGVVADALGIDLRAARIGRLLLSAVGNGETLPGDLEFRVTEALLAHVEDLCVEGRVALVLEDLHWADPSTLVFLHRLARRAGDLPLLVVGTRRAVPELPPLERLIEHLTHRGARRLGLGPLGGGEVEAMAQQVLGGPPGPRLVAHLEGASGNPLFVTELLAAADRSGDLVNQPEGAIELAADARPSPLSVLVLHRLSLLPAETLDTLRISAVLGTTFSVTDLCRVMDLSATDAARRLRPAQVSGSLAVAGDRFRFRHEVIREALYHDIPEPVRRSLHLQVARSLAETDAPAEEVAVQLLRGASPGDPDVAADLRNVAAELAGRAPGLAAEALARAVEVAPSPADREGLLTARAEVVLALDSEEDSEGEHFPLHLFLANFLFDAGRDDEADSAVKRAFADCEERGVRFELPYCHRMAALGCFLVGNWDDALVELEAGAALAEELDTRSGTAQGYAIAAFIALHRSDFPAATEALAAAEQEPMVIGPQHRRDWVLWVGGLMAEASGRKDQALALIWEAWQRCAAAGIASGFPLLGPDIVRLCLRTGDLTRGQSVAAAVEELVPEAGSPLVAAAALRCRGFLDGDPEALRDAAHLADAAGRPFVAARAAEEAAVVLAQRGETDEARAWLDDALRRYTALRASYDIGRVDARLRELGVRRGRQGSRRRPRHGWDALTDTERAVVALVAEGLSNPQIAERLFLSRHTVHTHVSHIFAKLGVNSRVELATEAMRQAR